MKKTSKKAKKVLTKGFLSGILCKLPQGEEKFSKKELQKISKKSKKLLTNESPRVILIKLSPLRRKRERKADKKKLQKR